jgi:hypothetical protein
MRAYRFDLVCPRCHKTSEATGTQQVPPPRVSCGDCLMDDVEIVELKVVRVTVENALS